MARIRTIKPEFWTDGDIMDLSPWARLLFIGSWNFALCDNGHVADDPRRLKMQVLPADDVDAAALVEEIIAAGRMIRVSVDNRTFLHIKRFTDHQKVEKRWSPRCPVCRVCGPESPENPPQTSPNLSEPLPNSPNLSPGKEGKGGEGRGTVVELVSQAHLASSAVDDDGLTRIRQALGGCSKAHARKQADYVLAKAPERPRNPVAYVLAAISESPPAFREKRGNPKRGQDCPTHAGEWADACRGCAADAKAKKEPA